MIEEASKDFFISYNKADRAWAEWVAWQLEAAGYTVVLQEWDFRPGGNFVVDMDEALIHTKRTIVLLSPHYLDLKAIDSRAEWAATFAKDPDGHKGMLLPVRVRECEPTGLLTTITHIDLIGCNAVAAKSRLLEGVHQSRAKPELEPLYPGNTPAKLLAVPTFPGDWPEVWHVPYSRNRFFTGRDELLSDLHEQLATTKPTALSQARAISGLGGIGKTQTALEYTYRYDAEYRYVLWVSAAKEETLRAEMVQLAARLQVPGQDEQDQDKTIEALKRWLTQQRDWLLILDNADALEMVAKYVPQGNRVQGHVLLTTRTEIGGAFAKIIEVEKMGRDDGVLLLLRRAHPVAGDAELNQSTEKDRADAEAIVDALDGLPLAIDQAGAYVEETQITLEGYLNLYQTRRKDLLSLRGSLPPAYPETVATTWNISFEQIKQISPVAADLLRLCAFLAPDAIPETIISEGAFVVDEAFEAVANNPIQFNEVIKVLRRYSLISRNPKDNTLSLHRLVQAVIHDGMSLREQRIWAERAVRAVAEVFPWVNNGTWRDAQPYLSHADVCVSLIERFELAFPEAASLLDAYGRYFYHTAQYKQAESLFLTALQISEETQGAEHGSVATRLHMLASLYQAQGHYTDAEPIYQRSLLISEQTQGPEHPDTAATLHALARLYYDQSLYAQAKPLIQRALHICEQALGPEHPDTAATLHALASLYQAQGRYTDAEPLYQRSLLISEQALGPEHPDTAATLHALAHLYYDQSLYAQAKPLIQRALHICEQALGPEHPHTIIARESYAILLEKMGQQDRDSS